MQQRPTEARVEVLSSSSDDEQEQQQQEVDQRQQQPQPAAPVVEEPAEEEEDPQDRSSWGPKEFKEAGNKKFAAGDKEGALDLYLAGLEVAEERPRPKPKALNIPPPPPPPPPAAAAASSSMPHDDQFDDEQQKEQDENKQSDQEQQQQQPKEEEAEPAPTPEQLAAWTLTAQLHCNAAYMLMELQRADEALPELDEAVRHDPNYLRAVQRRATCNWDLGKHSACYADIERGEQLGWRLDSVWGGRKVQAKAKMDEEMGKMWGQLKDLGNMFLGKFGLSTDNFKFDKDANTGGYSMRFEQGQQGGGAAQ